MTDRQCPSCGGFCKKSGCERANEPPQDPNHYRTKYILACDQKARIETWNVELRKQVDEWKARWSQENSEHAETIASAKHEIAELKKERDSWKLSREADETERRDLLETVEELTAAQARIAELREALDKMIDVAPDSLGQCSGYKCREPYCLSCNDEDSAEAYLQGVYGLCNEATKALATKDDTSALEAYRNKVIDECIEYSDCVSGEYLRGLKR